uniref:Uncharacterized protein n=1 Tax=Rhizobium rhizogenes TaxID=359 RepID=A0A7S5DQ97_RHIRH|nr:hypothetical protein pC5.7c_543 [Rhizobium rhizogenes]QCL09579.1 hypothetical protein pC5.8a_87 [Rhizobium rhizogenes]
MIEPECSSYLETSYLSNVYGDATFHSADSAEMVKVLLRTT